MAAIKFLSFTGQSGCYAKLPAEVLANSSVFTIEVKFSTSSYSTRSNNYQWGTLAGVEIGGNWQNDFGLCVNGGKLCFWAEPVSGGSDSTKNTTTNITVNDGNIHKAAVVSNADGSIDLYCDGINVAHTNAVNATIADKDVYIAYNGNRSLSRLQMDLYEVRFWNVARSASEIFAQIDGTENGLQGWYIPSNAALNDYSGNGRHATLFGNPAFTEISFPLHVNLTADVVRLVYTPFIIHSDTSAFYQKFFTDGFVFDSYDYNLGTASLDVHPFGEQVFQFPDSDEVWFRFYLYVSGNYLLKVFVDKEGNESGVAVDRYLDETSSLLNGQLENIPMDSFDGLSFSDEEGLLGHYLIHLKKGVTDGLVEIWFANPFFVSSPDYYKIVKVAEKTGNVNNGLPLNKIRITLTGDDSDYTEVDISDGSCALSYIVVSNSEIDMQGNRAPVKVQSLCDVQRDIFRSAVFSADVIRKIPHRVVIAPQDPLIDETGGVQSIQIELAAQQLTDRVTYTSINPADIMQQIRGQFLDYNFDMRVEEITQNGALYTCHLCSDIDELLYTQFTYAVPPNYHVIYRADLKNRRLEQMNPGWSAHETEDVEIRKATARAHLYHFGDVLNIKKQGVIRFDDFVSDLDIEQKNVTYADLISNLFGWTSRIPQMMIHCYFRDDKIFVIQRGLEDYEVDISNLKHSAPTVNKKIMRTTWGSSPDEEYSLEKINPGLAIRPPPPYVSDDGKTFYTYKSLAPHGYLLTGTRTINDDGSVVQVDYSYTISAPYNLTKEHSVTYDEHGHKIDEHTIQHNYLTPSQTHSIWVEDGNNESSVVGSHVAGFYDELITLQETTTDTKTFKIYGNPLIDTSFPVVNQDKLAELSAAIRWLNRKTQETITMDIYDFPHVIDFNDRIILDGNSYFLESNSATRTPRIVNKQSITIVRWY